MNTFHSTSARADTYQCVTTTPCNTILQGDCIAIMRRFERGWVDFILTDPPYITRYHDRDGRAVANDDNSRWLKPSFNQMHRVLKPGGFCVSFYGWNKIDLFMGAWRSAGFRVVGHVVFRKRYASSSRFFQYRHEQAYLLAKGEVAYPEHPIPDVIDFDYTGNRLHPTQEPVAALRSLVECFTRPGDLVLDPFCGSGSTLEAAQQLGRHWLGVELNEQHQPATRPIFFRTSPCAPEYAAGGRPKGRLLPRMVLPAGPNHGLIEDRAVTLIEGFEATIAAISALSLCKILRRAQRRIGRVR